ncbi:hypothetical protein GALMADRAFT_226115 [Galerina marginata CBS 339.88]|uniref:Uncharacterized protein n=1 Tax=Galerina marginata (strain CBS 339.88) TaxID=685588 RepID=A0A067SZK7_GALM3|nr:hypothetical protein GALMADRAFT_226115 [Galerina marginata CBS 339.88]
MFANPYLPHVIYGLALTSVSMNLVSKRRSTEEEKNRVKAQISILESIKQQSESDDPLSTDELDRLKKLARHSATADAATGAESTKGEVKWSDIFRGQKPVASETVVSKWDKQDMETLQKELSK